MNYLSSCVYIGIESWKLLVGIWQGWQDQQKNTMQDKNDSLTLSIMVDCPKLMNDCKRCIIPQYVYQDNKSKLGNWHMM